VGEGLVKLRELVLADATLQARLRGLPDREAFVSCAVEIAGEHGLHVSREDVEDGLREAQREWLERWI
jgi:hypothetical protein